MDDAQPRRGPALSRPALRPVRAAHRPPRRLGRGRYARLPSDAARGVRDRREPRSRLRMASPQYRLRRDDHRPAYGRADDQYARDQAGRQGARNRHRLGLPVCLSFEPDPQRLVDRDHPRAGAAHARALRLAHRARLWRIPRNPDSQRRWILRLGGCAAIRQDHRHLRHRSYSPAAAPAAHSRRGSWSFRSGRPAPSMS